MQTVVEHISSGKRYLFLGVAATHVATGDRWGPGLSFNTEERRLVCVADAAGRLEWFEAAEVRVVEVGGVSPGDVVG